MLSPRLPEKLITRLISEAYLDEILGDLQEEYQNNVSKKGNTRAAISYWISTIRFINTRTLKRNTTFNSAAMIKNYLIIALRNITRQKIYSVINIGGLAIGIACSILLGLYVHNELSYDRLHEKADHIEIGLWPMVLGFLLTMVIAILTISFESLKAALLNPIIALRSE